MLSDRNVLVYLFTGFLESGKSTFINDTLRDPDFNEGERNLLLCFEEGEVEYDHAYLKQHCNTDVVYVDSFDQVTLEFLEQLDTKYAPDRVIVEFNGTWPVTQFLDMEMPLDWMVVQIVATVDAGTFMNYVTNMKSLMYEQLVHAELIVFNRCDESTKKSFLRGNIKAMNRNAQIIYEDIYGNVNQLAEDDLPFDVSKDALVIEDDDYGLWYMDALEHPTKYEHKQLTIKGIAFHTEQFGKPIIALGRYAMVCCEDDTSFIGIGVLDGDISGIQDGDWVVVSGRVQVDYDDESNMDYISLVNADISSCEALKDPLVYFN